LEPVGADEVGIVGERVRIAGIGGAVFAFAANPDQPFPKEPAIDRAEMKFADQPIPSEHQLRCAGIGDRPPVNTCEMAMARAGNAGRLVPA